MAVISAPERAVLRSMRDRFAVGPETWTQGAYARDVAGHPTAETNLYATCWCLVGATNRAACDQSPRHRAQLFTAVHQALADAAHVTCLSAWNDAPDRRYEDVLALVDQVLEVG